MPDEKLVTDNPVTSPVSRPVFPRFPPHECQAGFRPSLGGRLDRPDGLTGEALPPVIEVARVDATLPAILADAEIARFACCHHVLPVGAAFRCRCWCSSRFHALQCQPWARLLQDGFTGRVRISGIGWRPPAPFGVTAKRHRRFPCQPGLVPKLPWPFLAIESRPVSAENRVQIPVTTAGALTPITQRAPATFLRPSSVVESIAERRRRAAVFFRRNDILGSGSVQV